MPVFNLDTNCGSAFNCGTIAIPSGRMIRQFSLSQLVKSILTVGRERQDLGIYGIHSVYDLRFRLALIRAYTTISGGFIDHSPAYCSLDPSEKGGISYFLGLAFAKLVGSYVLGIDPILHLDVYKNTLGALLPVGSRPDLVGLLGRDHIIFEVKGYSSGISRNLKDKAKGQARIPVSIGGINQALGMSCITYKKKRRLCFYYEDPDARGEVPVNDITLLGVIEDYYRIFFDLIKPHVRGMTIDREMTLEHMDMDISIDGDLYNSLRSNRYDQVAERIETLRGHITPALASINNPEQHATHGGTYIRSHTEIIDIDGISITLGRSWEDVVE